jgi:hypothetical protein
MHTQPAQQRKHSMNDIGGATTNERERNKLAETAIRMVINAGADQGTAADVFIIALATTLANLSLSDIDRLAEKAGRKIAELAHHFRMENLP